MATGFERTVEISLGEPIEQVRNMTISDRRDAREKNSGKRVRFSSYFPLVGRGNVLRDRVVNHEDAESALRKALRGE
jgi:hypothetical protein